MGTQQNLLLIIVVFTVGLAVFVGLIAFNQMVVKSNRNACIEDMNKFVDLIKIKLKFMMRKKEWRI